MAQPAANLRVLDEVSISRELDLVSHLFHRINRIIPENQIMLKVPPETSARDALALMRDHGYSQVPVVAGNEVLGVFSYRSFSNRAAKSSWQEVAQHKITTADLPVDECMEEFQFARVTAEMKEVFEAMDRDNGILIGSPEKLQGILTPMDFLRYLYDVASPFVMISEIELALRALIRISVSESELVECAVRCLSQHYGSEEKVPKSLEEMTFSDYKSILQHGQNWPKFQGVFGGNRQLTAGKLNEVGELRNDLFHFKREITLLDHQCLNGHRNWLLSKARQADVRRRTGVSS